MPRVRKGAAKNRQRKRILRAARGYWGTKSRHKQQAKVALLRAGQYAYRDRRRRKRDFRRLWISRINAAARLNGVSYSQLIHGLNQASVTINRKILADLAVRDPEAFTAVVEQARAHL